MPNEELRVQHGIKTLALAGGYPADKELIMQGILEKIPSSICAAQPLATMVLESGDYEEYERLSLLQASTDDLLDQEYTMIQEAYNNKKNLIVYDTGNTFGNAAFSTQVGINTWTDNEWESRTRDIKQMIHIMGEFTSNMFKRYDIVVTLPYYHAENYPDNYRMSQTTRDFWTPHPNKIEIDSIRRYRVSPVDNSQKVVRSAIASIFEACNDNN